MEPLIPPISNEDILARVLASPELLWKIKTSKKKVIGPWVPARSEKQRVGYMDGSIWRLNHKGQSIVVVHPYWEGCDGWRKPNPGDYSMFQDDEYEADLVKYKEAVAVRAERGWVYRIDEENKGYAHSKEEAVTLADAILREKGYLLLDSLDEFQMKKYTA